MFAALRFSLRNGGRKRRGIEDKDPMWIRLAGLSMSKKKPDWSEEDELRFKELWIIFPPRNGRKSGKAYAKECLQRLSPDEELWVEILHAAKVFRAYCDRMDCFPPDLSRWINRKLWTDEIDISQLERR